MPRTFPPRSPRPVRTTFKWLDRTQQLDSKNAPGRRNLTPSFTRNFATPRSLANMINMICVSKRTIVDHEVQNDERERYVRGMLVVGAAIPLTTRNLVSGGDASSAQYSGWRWVGFRSKYDDGHAPFRDGIARSVRRAHCHLLEDDSHGAAHFYSSAQQYVDSKNRFGPTHKSFPENKLAIFRNPDARVANPKNRLFSIYSARLVALLELVG